MHIDVSELKIEFGKMHRFSLQSKRRTNAIGQFALNDLAASFTGG